MDLGVPVSCFKDSLLALGGRLNTTSVLTPHHLAPHVRGKGMQESPAFSLSDWLRWLDFRESVSSFDLTGIYKRNCEFTFYFFFLSFEVIQEKVCTL